MVCYTWCSLKHTEKISSSYLTAYPSNSVAEYLWFSSRASSWCKHNWPYFLFSIYFLWFRLARIPDGRRPFVLWMDAHLSRLENLKNVVQHSEQLQLLWVQRLSAVCSSIQSSLDLSIILKWGCYFWKILYKFSAITRESQNLRISILIFSTHRKSLTKPILHLIDFNLIHSQTYRYQQVTQERYFPKIKVAFLRFYLKLNILYQIKKYF